MGHGLCMYMYLKYVHITLFRAVSLVFLWEPVPAVRASISKSNDRVGKQALNRFDALRSLDFTTVQLSEFAVRGLACQLRALLLAEE